MTVSMALNPLDDVQPSSAAWNCHDVADIAVGMIADDVYFDPEVPHKVSGDVLVKAINQLWPVPNAHSRYELVGVEANGSDRDTSQWIMRGKNIQPGELVVSVREANPPQDMERIRKTSRAVAVKMFKMKGFISHRSAVIGNRMVTITAWENPGDSRGANPFSV